MPSTSRRVIQMRFFDDFTYEEMADELGFTLQQVKNAMHRAKRDLIELIELQAYDDVLPKEQIYNQVWKEPYYRAEDNVMSLIRRIRKKIEPDPSKPIYVLTVWGIGYKFNNAIKRK